MKTKLHALLSIFLIIPFMTFSQVQIGQDLNGEAINDYFGFDISISSDGTIVATCAPYYDWNGIESGLVRIYENIGGVWTQVGNSIYGQGDYDYIGSAVSLSSDGTIVAVGSTLHDGDSLESGLLRVYENLGGVWTQIGQDIYGEAEGDRFGHRVSLSSDGSIVAASSYWNNSINGSGSGHVRIYENIGGVWTQIGEDIDGEASNDESGRSISLSSDGSIIAIGAPYNNGNGTASGHIRVYENIGGVWTQIGQDIDGDSSTSLFGRNVDLSSDGSILGITGYLNGDSTGNARIYENIAGVWTQVGQDIFGEALGDRFGSSISLSSDGNIVAVGANRNDGNGEDSGHVRIFRNISGVWTQVGQDIDGAAAHDHSGFPVSLSSDGSIVAICAAENDDNGSDSGEVRIFDLSAILSSDEFVLSKVSLYPNPTKDMLTITTTGLMQKVSIADINGRTVLKQTGSNNSNLELDLSSLSKGMYFVNVTTDSGSETVKIVKQ